MTTQPLPHDEDDQTATVEFTYNELRATQAALNRHRKVRERGLAKARQKQLPHAVRHDTAELVAVATAVSKIRAAMRRTFGRKVAR